MTLHDDELAVDASLVRRLVADQLPALAGLPVHRLAATGSSNAIFGLGEELLVRLPRQPGGSATIRKEARWTPYLAPHLPVALPEVVAVGAPGHGYGEEWSVVGRLEGTAPPPVAVGDLAAVVRALGDVPVPAEALADPALRWYRAEPLAAVDDDVRAWAQECRSLPGLDLDLDAALRTWDEAVALPAGPPTAPRWVHGDLFAENLLVRDGRLVAVLDLGGLAVGDPAVDLAVAWELLDPTGREAFRAEVGVDDRTWLVGRAWALAIALMTLPYYGRTMPERCRSRLVAARAVLADAGPG